MLRPKTQVSTHASARAAVPVLQAPLPAHWPAAGHVHVVSTMQSMTMKLKTEGTRLCRRHEHASSVRGTNPTAC